MCGCARDPAQRENNKDDRGVCQSVFLDEGHGQAVLPVYLAGAQKIPRGTQCLAEAANCACSDLAAWLKRAIERLREGVDLIIMPSSGECAKLAFKIFKPWRTARQTNRSSFDSAGRVIQPHHLVPLGLDRNGMDVFAFEILNEANAGAFVLNQERIAVTCITPLSMDFNSASSQIRIFESSRTTSKT